MTRPLRKAYCTLNHIIRQLNASSADVRVSTNNEQTAAIINESDNFQAEIKKDIYVASDRITQAMNNVFVPYNATYTWRSRQYRHDLGRYDAEYGGRPFTLPDGNLSVTTFTWDGTVLVENTDFFRNLLRGYPSYEFILDPDSLTTYPDDFSDSVSIVGVWGYHPHPDNLWLDSTKTVQNTTQISATGTALEVGTGGAAAFEIYQYLRIESEYLFITDISSNTLTVQRGVNGTTAAAHANDTQIDTLELMEDVAQECARLALREYHLRSGLEIVPAGETALDLRVGAVQLPSTYRRYITRAA